MTRGKSRKASEVKGEADRIIEAVRDIAAILNSDAEGALRLKDVHKNALMKAIKKGIKPEINFEIAEKTTADSRLMEVSFSGGNRPYSAYGAFYKRTLKGSVLMTPREMKKLLTAPEGAAAWEDEASSDALEIVDGRALRKFYDKALALGRIAPMKEYDGRTFLKRQGFLKNGKLTNAGRVLFSSNKPVGLKTVLFLGDARLAPVDDVTSYGNVFELIEFAFAYALAHIAWRKVRAESGEEREIPEVPLTALREIIVNSFAHADYRSEGIHELAFTPTEIEIFSPGAFPAAMTPENCAGGKAKPLPRNPLVLSALAESGDAEALGMGFRKVFSTCRASGTRYRYEMSDKGFSFFFIRERPMARIDPHVFSQVPPKRERPLMAESFFGASRLLPTDFAVLDILRMTPVIPRRAIAAGIARTTRTVQRSLNKLVKAGKIVRVGSKKDSRWKVLDQGLS